MGSFPHPSSTRGGEPCAPAGARPSFSPSHRQDCGKGGHPVCPCPDTLVTHLQPSDPESPRVYAIILASLRPGVPGGRVATALSGPRPCLHPLPELSAWGPGSLGVFLCLASHSRAAGCVWPLSACPCPAGPALQGAKGQARAPGAGRNRPRQGAVWSGDSPPSSPGRLRLGIP